jgi:hypothetical protein
MSYGILVYLDVFITCGTFETLAAVVRARLAAGAETALAAVTGRKRRAIAPGEKDDVMQE